MSLHLVHAPFDAPNPVLAAVEVRVDRRQLAKRVWRARASDGTDFGFELEQPLASGDCIFQSATARYVIVQEPEPVLEIPLQLSASTAAGIGWALGNRHLELMGEGERLLTPAEEATRVLLQRLNVPFREVVAVFRPGRFARGAPTEPARELGPSHQHDAPKEGLAG